MKESFLKNKIFISLVFTGLLVGGSLVFAFSDLKPNFNFRNLLAKIEVFAQETSLEFMPRYPQRIMFLVDELSWIMEDLSFLTEDLKNDLKKCDCKNAQSLCGNFDYTGCGSSIVVGDPCPNRTKIEDNKEELGGKIRELVFLRDLLKTEMESGLMKEIETLPPDFAQEMKDALNLLLDDTQKTIKEAEKIYDLSQKSPLDACVALCLPGDFPEFDLCAATSHDSIKINLKLSVGLQDLDLGYISVGKINLPLPEEIEIGRLGKLTPLKIQGTEFSFSVDNPLDVIQLQPTRLPLPEEKPYLRFSCPELPRDTEIRYDPSEAWAVCSNAGWCEDHKEECEKGTVDPNLAPLCDVCKVGVFVRGRGQVLHKIENGAVDSCTGVVRPSVGSLACNAFCLHTAELLHNPHKPQTFTYEEMLPYKTLFDHFGFEIPQVCHCGTFPDQTGKYAFGVACGIWETHPPPPELKCHDLKGCYNCENMSIDIYGKDKDSVVDTEWYFNIFQNLSDLCLDLPGNSEVVKEEKLPSSSGKDCLDPEKVVEKILKDCEPIDIYACKKAKYCQTHQDPGCNSIGYVRGLGSAFSDPNTGSVDRCSGPHVKSSDTLNKKMCRFFCVEVADTLYERGETVTFSQEDMKKHAKEMFDYLFPGKPIPLSCTCNKDWDIAQSTRFTDGCSQCKPIRQIIPEDVPCNYLSDTGKIQACREFSQAIGQAVPSECSSDPVATMKNKCQELKELKKIGETIPNEDKVYFYCGLVALYEGKIEKPGGQKSGGEAPIFEDDINDNPSTIPGCSASFPTIPKLCLPSLKVSDLDFLPEIKLDKLVKIKPPSLIIEDVNFPCWELCDLDACYGLFRAFNFAIPGFSLPTIEIPPIGLGAVGGVSLPDLQIPPISFPSVPYPILRAPNFQNLIVPELHYSGAQVPLPTLGFSLEGIDFGPILNYIVTFIKNALGIPDGCISVQVPSPSIPIEIIFPDYYFGWPKIPDLPEIPFCKDINLFCLNMKEKLNNIPEISEKFREIENFFNSFVQKEIQSKLDDIAFKVQQTIYEEIQGRLEEIREDVRRQVEEQIAQGKKEIRVRIEDIDLPSIDLDKLTGFPLKVPIPWPEELKEIILKCDQGSYNQCMDNVYQQCEKQCKQQYEDKCSLPYLKCVTLCQMERGFEECAKTYLACLGYPLPKVPLSCLSYDKSFTINGPGMETTAFSFGVSGTNCIGQSPIGGNPYPIDKIQSAVQEIKNYQTRIEGASQKIIDVLQ